MLRAALFTTLGLLLIAPQLTAADAPEIVSVAKIWDQGKHNAFTDLIRWHDRWYCTFREADAHVGGDGKLRVLESADGKTWESVALVAEKGIDLRDPKLSITPDDRLMIVAGGSVYDGKTLLGRQPRVTFSKDARTWTEPQRVLTEGEWLWRVTWHRGRAYGVSYNASARQTKEAQDAAKDPKPASPGPADWKLKLFVSEDGVKYDLVTHLDVPGHPNETTLRFLPNDEMMALVRREGGNQMGWIGVSKAPYREWKWHETKYRLGGPNFLAAPDGSLWATSRLHPKGPKTAVVRLGRDEYEPVLELPSGGDTSYAGMAWHNGLLWISYYASHEGKSAIYVATVRVPQQPLEIGSRLEPFLDDHLIEKLTGDVRIAVQQPEPMEVALTADSPWEGNTSAYFTVFRDDDRFRMYYRGSHFDEKSKKSAHRELACYAESKDGVTWTKPKLGLFEFDGSKDNNIIWDGPGTHNFTPFRDTNPKATAEGRYKALALVPGGLIALQSGDGVRWSKMSDKPVITRGAFDSQNLAFWDSAAGKYREYHRGFRGGVRDIMTGTSDDFLTWTDPDFVHYTGATREHLYTNAIQPYERAPHLLVGFPTRFLPAKQQTEPTLMVSRDGIAFHRYADAVIPTTAPEYRDGNRSNYMAWSVVKLPGKEDELSVYAKERYYTGPGSRVRRFRYRVDGFAAATVGEKGGELLTRPLQVKGDKLVLNYAATAGGSVRVSLLDMANKVLGQSELRGDAVAEVVDWKAAINGPVRLRFEMTNAKVYSFRFQ